MLGSVGDVLTTFYGLQLAGVSEGNPVARQAMDLLGTGPALIVLKLAMIGAAIVLYRRAENYEWAVPATVAIISIIVSLLNITTIMAV